MYNTLVLSGGSVKGVGVLGALHYIEESTSLAELNEFYGTSAGALICVLIALGHSSIELFQYFIRFEFSIEPIVARDNMQLLDYSKFIKTLEQIVVTRTPVIPTLSALAAMGKKVYILTYNYTQARLELLSYKTHPDMLCTDAVRLSCALPIVFGKNMYKNNIYFDGGLVCNFPLNIAFKHKAKNILAINLLSNSMRSFNDDYLSVFINLIFAPIEVQTREIIRKYAHKCAFIEIDVPISFTSFKVELTLALACFIHGYNIARAAL